MTDDVRPDRRHRRARQQRRDRRVGAAVTARRSTRGSATSTSTPPARSCACGRWSKACASAAAARSSPSPPPPGASASPTPAPTRASKHAVVGLTRAVAAELAGTGVTGQRRLPHVRAHRDDRRARSKISSPGPAGRRRRAEQALADSSPLGRLLEPEEVADAVVFLASPAAPRSAARPGDRRRGYPGVDATARKAEHRRRGTHPGARGRCAPAAAGPARAGGAGQRRRDHHRLSAPTRLAADRAHRLHARAEGHRQHPDPAAHRLRRRPDQALPGAVPAARHQRRRRRLDDDGRRRADDGRQAADRGDARHRPERQRRRLVHRTGTTAAPTASPSGSASTSTS